jgi:hypothetical protein
MAHRVSNMLDPNRTKRCFFIGISSSFMELAQTDRFEPTNRVITRTIKKKAAEPTPIQGIEPCITCPISLNPRFVMEFYNESGHRVTFFCLSGKGSGAEQARNKISIDHRGRRGDVLMRAWSESAPRGHMNQSLQEGSLRP